MLVCAGWFRNQGGDQGGKIAKLFDIFQVYTRV